MVNTIEDFVEIREDNVNLEFIFECTKTKLIRTVIFIVIIRPGLNPYCSWIRIEFSDG